MAPRQSPRKYILCEILFHTLTGFKYQHFKVKHEKKENTESQTLCCARGAVVSPTRTFMLQVSLAWPVTISNDCPAEARLCEDLDLSPVIFG